MTVGTDKRTNKLKESHEHTNKQVWEAFENYFIGEKSGSTSGARYKKTFNENLMIYFGKLSQDISSY